MTINIVEEWILSMDSSYLTEIYAQNLSSTFVFVFAVILHFFL